MRQAQPQASAGTDAAPLGPDMTIAQAALLRELLLPLLEAASGDLVLDLHGVTDCDSSGVQLLLAARASLAARGHSLLLTHASPAVRDALATFGLADLLTHPLAS